jgi:hypothetical protein
LGAAGLRAAGVLAAAGFGAIVADVSSVAGAATFVAGLAGAFFAVVVLLRRVPLRGVVLRAMFVQLPSGSLIK